MQNHVFAEDVCEKGTVHTQKKILLPGREGTRVANPACIAVDSISQYLLANKKDFTYFGWRDASPEKRASHAEALAKMLDQSPESTKKIIFSDGTPSIALAGSSNTITDGAPSYIRLAFKDSTLVLGVHFWPIAKKFNFHTIQIGKPVTNPAVARNKRFANEFAAQFEEFLFSGRPEELTSKKEQLAQMHSILRTASSVPDSVPTLIRVNMPSDQNRRSVELWTITKNQFGDAAAGKIISSFYIFNTEHRAAGDDGKYQGFSLSLEAKPASQTPAVKSLPKKRQP